ncbi:MAG: hypothetical protein IJ343_13820 [Clostridia bacterium]|nr:hypothetical protein [Clostridia bacterium]
MMEEKKIIPETNEIEALTDEQLEEVSGGVMVRIAATTVLKCAVDARHYWPAGCKACPVCGSTKFIRTAMPK